MLGTSLGFEQRKGLINWPKAPPKGFAREAIAVADTRPRGLNQSSEYRVGAASTNGCARPMRIWPNIVTPYRGGDERVPAYRIQLPHRMRIEAVRKARRGPPA